MHPFDDLSEAQSALQRLMNREPPLVKVLARQPGTKESRYIHLLSGDEKRVSSTDGREVPAALEGEKMDGFSRVSSGMAELRRDVADLKQQFAAFRKQFE
jgi:hypothetical protein